MTAPRQHHTTSVWEIFRRARSQGYNMSAEVLDYARHQPIIGIGLTLVDGGHLSYERALEAMVVALSADLSNARRELVRSAAGGKR